METFPVRAFVAASRERNIARAAGSLSVTSSPVSRALREFEKQVGGPVFVRAYHDLQLTELGRRALPVAVELIAHLDALQGLGGVRAPVRLGATPWGPSRYLDELLTLADGAEIVTDVSSALLHLLRHGALDLAVVHLPVPEPDIATRTLGHYRFSAIVRASDPLADRTGITLADLADRDVLTMPTSMQPAPMTALIDRLRAAGVASHSEVDPKDYVGIRALLRRTGSVLLGVGAGDLARDRGGVGRRSGGADRGVVAVRLEDELDFWIGLAWRAGMTVGRERVDALVATVHPRPGEELDVIR